MISRYRSSKAGFSLSGRKQPHALLAGSQAEHMQNIIAKIM
jgi:hypothetical protein